MSFPAGSGGLVNSNVLHATKSLDSKKYDPAGSHLRYIIDQRVSRQPAGSKICPAHHRFPAGGTARFLSKLWCQMLSLSQPLLAEKKKRKGSEQKNKIHDAVRSGALI